MTAYILLMLLWTPSQQTSGAVNGVEFANKASCESAAASAKKKFEGPLTTFYWVCAPKNVSE